MWCRRGWVNAAAPAAGSAVVVVSGRSTRASATAKLLSGAALGALLISSGAHAASFTIVNGQTATTTQTLNSTGDVGTIESGGAISTSGNLGVFSTGLNNAVNNNGTVTTLGSFASGIVSGGDNASINNSGTITTSGGGAEGILSDGSGATITNSGTITTSGESADGIYSGGNGATITNSGTITSVGPFTYAILSGGDNATITNSGTITASSGASGIYSVRPGAVITNSGTITTSGVGIISYGSDATIINRGTILGGSAAISVNRPNAIVNLLAGTAIQGGIDLRSDTTLNIGTGLNTALTLTGVPTTINTAGQPRVLSGSTLAVVDPTGFAAADAFAFDFAGTIADTVDARMAPSDSAAMTTGSIPGDAVPSRRGFWITGLGLYSDRGASAPLDGFHYGAFGVMAGVDRSLSASTLAGIFGGITHGGIKTAAGSTQIDATGGFAGAYWSRDDGRTFAHLSVAAGGFLDDSSRIVANNLVTGGLETASASYGSFYVDPAVTFGLHRRMGDATVSPSLGLRYTGLYQQGYTESGSTADMAVGSRTAQQLDVRGEIRTDFAPQVSDAGVGRFDLSAGVDGLFSWSGNVDATLLATQIAFATHEPDAVARGFVGAGTTFTAANGLTFKADAEAGYDTADTFTLAARASIHKSF
jgi:uncharacterized protein with beta-barrel porin domain